MSDVATYALRLGDDALVLSHRLAEWVTRAPELEEDVALTNMALDLLGQARPLLSMVGDEDELAYGRDERDFSNCQLVELPNGDFAVTIARQLVFSSYQWLLYDELRDSGDETLAGVAAKAVKEVAYHRDHAVQWTLRLGAGTEESHRRMQAGLERVWPYVDELFEADDVTNRLVGKAIGVDAASLRSRWDIAVGDVLERATLSAPDVAAVMTGGRHGRHTEHLGYLLAEMQHLHRSHPGARW